VKAEHAESSTIHTKINILGGQGSQPWLAPWRASGWAVPVLPDRKLIKINLVQIFCYLLTLTLAEKTVMDF